MYKCTPKEIIAAVPGVQTVHLSASWFNELDSEKSVFESLYNWMTECGRIPDENGNDQPPTFPSCRFRPVLYCVTQKRE